MSDKDKKSGIFNEDKAKSKSANKIEETVEVKVKKTAASAKSAKTGKTTKTTTTKKAAAAKKATKTTKTTKKTAAAKVTQEPVKKAESTETTDRAKEATTAHDKKGIRMPHVILQDLENADARHDPDALRYGFAELQASLTLESKEATETYNDLLKKVFYVATAALLLGLLNIFLLMAGGCSKSSTSSAGIQGDVAGELQSLKELNEQKAEILKTHTEQVEIFRDLLKIQTEEVGKMIE